ncbi:MAG: protein translocase subunit SecF [Patescibacteria group bacterium]
MKYTKLWFSISALLIIPGIIALVTWGLRFGIDFRGGTLIELKFSQADIQTEQIRTALADVQLENLIVQPAGQGSVFLRTGPIDTEKHTQIGENIKNKLGEYLEARFESVGPTVSQDLTKKAIIAVIFASIVIIFYIAFAFRGVPKPASSWRFGISAVAALAHDLLFVVGAFAILGHFFHYEVDSLFITALLTVMGFSVHDTIVVFDRLRENLRKSPSRTFSEIADLAITQTLGRSLATSLTVVFVLLSLFLLGGESIKPFVLALLLGVTIGTYSSIFNATPLLVVWQNAATRRR